MSRLTDYAIARGAQTAQEAQYGIGRDALVTYLVTCAAVGLLLRWVL